MRWPTQSFTQMHTAFVAVSFAAVFPGADGVTSTTGCVPQEHGYLIGKVELLASQPSKALFQRQASREFPSKAIKTSEFTGQAASGKEQQNFTFILDRWAHLMLRSDPTERVIVSHKDFDDKLRGRSFKHWKDFKQALGPDAEVEADSEGELRLMSGLAICFVVIVNVLIFSLIGFVVSKLKDDGERRAMWATFALLIVYSLIVSIYCSWAYEREEQRVVAYFMFGMVPFSISAASYVLAALLLDLLRSTTTKEGFNAPLSKRMDPFDQSIAGRFIFWLAVFPGLLVSIYLGSSISTGFAGGALHFDILSLCLFIDLFRFVGHFAYLVAPVWSIGKSPDAISSRPGLCYVFYVLCFVCFGVLARVEVVKSGVLLADDTRIHSLVCLTSFVFLPLSLYLTYMNLQEFFDLFEERRLWLETTVLLFLVTLNAAFMLLVAMYFDALEPNLMGIVVIIGVVIYAAYQIGQGSLAGFIVAMIPLSMGAFAAVFLAVQSAADVREKLHSAVAW